MMVDWFCFMWQLSMRLVCFGRLVVGSYVNSIRRLDIRVDVSFCWLVVGGRCLVLEFGSNLYVFILLDVAVL